MGDQYTLAHGQTPRVLDTGQPIEPGVPFEFGKDGPSDEDKALIEQDLIMAVPTAPPEKKAAQPAAKNNNTGGDR